MMETEIGFLKELEEDLLEAAERESLGPERSEKVRRLEPGRRGKHPRHGRSRGRWMAVAASVVAFLIAAGVLGWIATPHGAEKRAVPGSVASPTGAYRRQLSVFAGQPSLAGPSSEKALAQGADAQHRIAGEGVGGGGAAGSAVTDQAVVPGPSPAPGTAPGGGGDLTYAPGTVRGAGSAVTAPNIGGAPGMGEVSKVVKTAQLSVVVPRNGFQEAFAAASKVGKRYGGFVESSTMETPRRGHMIIRVQARYFDEAMDELRALGRVESESMGGQDVTAQFVDLKARLEIVQNRKDLLVGLQKKAASADQILRYENLIEDAQLQIEQIKGRIKLINNQASKATIRLDMREAGVPAASVKPQENVTNPNLFTAWKRAVAGFLTMVGFVLVGLGYLVPVVAIVAGLWLAMGAIRRARRRAFLAAP